MTLAKDAEELLGRFPNAWSTPTSSDGSVRRSTSPSSPWRRTSGARVVDLLVRLLLAEGGE